MFSAESGDNTDYVLRLLIKMPSSKLQWVNVVANQLVKFSQLYTVSFTILNQPQVSLVNATSN